jgi:DNA-binding NarL/FixJ family response regulator
MRTSLPKIRISKPTTLRSVTRKDANIAKPKSSAVKLRAVIIEDQSAICDMLAELISKHGRYAVVGQAADGKSGIEIALNLRPDLLVLDVMMPGLSGIEVLRRINRALPATKVLIFSGKKEPHIIRSLVQEGIHGFVHKTDPLSEFRRAVDSLANGQPWFSENFDRTVREALATPANHADSMLDQLTPREREIAVLITRSHSSKEVAGQLQISIKTAENHRANLMRKLGVRDVAGLVRFVIRQGLVDPTGDAA